MRFRFSSWQALVLSTVAVTFSAASAQAQRITSLDFLGQAIFPARSLVVDGTTVGGLSGIAYNGSLNQYTVLSDDQGNLGLGAPRFYTATINVGPNDPANSFDSSDVTFNSATTFTSGGTPFAAATVDIEGVARAGNTLFVPDEGFANNGIAPVVRRFNATTGAQTGVFSAPGYFTSDNATDTTGIRNNAAFEAITLGESGTLLVGTEGPLKQESAPEGVPGNAASIYNSPNNVRLLQYNASNGNLLSEFVYETDALTVPITVAGQFGVQGLVELLYTGNGNYLALERSFTITGDPTVTGYDIKLYQFTLDGATNVTGTDTLTPGSFTPVQKQLLLNLSDLGIPLDNIEGMTFGPGANNRYSLILVGDDNFSTGNGNGPGTPAQFTQILAFGASVAAPEPGTLALALPIVFCGAGILRRKA